MVDRRRSARELAQETLRDLDDSYLELLSLLDVEAVIQRVVEDVPQLAGFDVAWVGRPDGDDRLVLGNSVGARTDLLEGLVVPRGIGLGGRVLTSHTPMWVKNYITSPQITHDFATQAQVEGLQSMIAVPILHGERVLGVLYGSHRFETDYGDRTAHLLDEIAARTAAATVVAERARHAAEVAVHEERRRVALELHDTVGAMLYTLGAGIRTLGAEVSSKALPEIRQRLQNLEEQAAEASAALRGSLRILSAPPEQVALGVALREDAHAFQERSGVTTRVITLTELPPLPRSRIRALSDATREALLNVEKHAKAESVVVTVFATAGGVAVTVSDDGVGLRDGPPSRGGLGLMSISDRLARMGGRVTISDTDDGGVSMQAWLPR